MPPSSSSFIDVAADVSPLIISPEKFEPTHVGCYDGIFHELPIKIPAKKTSAPPSATWNNADAHGVSMNRWRIHELMPSSISTTHTDTVAYFAVSVPPNKTRLSFVPKGLHRVHFRRPQGGVDAENHADQRRDAEGQRR
jgi:hypothetical protein